MALVQAKRLKENKNFLKSLSTIWTMEQKLSLLKEHDEAAAEACPTTGASKLSAQYLVCFSNDEIKMFK